MGVALFADTIKKILGKFGWDYKSSIVRLGFDSLSATRRRLSSVQKHTYDKDSFYCCVHRLNYEHILNLVCIDVEHIFLKLLNSSQYLKKYRNFAFLTNYKTNAIKKTKITLWIHCNGIHDSKVILQNEVMYISVYPVK